MERLSYSAAAMDEIDHRYRDLLALVPLRPIRGEEDYARAIGALEGLLDAGAGDENHRLAEMVAALGTFIEEYEAGQRTLPEATPAEVLRFLMDRHGLRQGDLPEIGSQGVASEILTGKRALNAGQIERLARRFGVSPASFFSKGSQDTRTA